MNFLTWLILALLFALPIVFVGGVMFTRARARSSSYTTSKVTVSESKVISSDKKDDHKKGDHAAGHASHGGGPIAALFSLVFWWKWIKGIVVLAVLLAAGYAIYSNWDGITKWFTSTDTAASVSPPTPIEPNANPPDSDIGIPKVEVPINPSAPWSLQDYLPQDWGIGLGAIALITLLYALWLINKKLILIPLGIIALLFIFYSPSTMSNWIASQNDEWGQVEALSEPKPIGTFKVGETPVPIAKRKGHCVRPTGAGSEKVKATADTSPSLVYYVTRGATQVRIDFAWFPLSSTECK